jgi:hypothetical protein
MLCHVGTRCGQRPRRMSTPAALRPPGRGPAARASGTTAAGFLARAKVWFAAHGITHIHRIVTDNGACYRSDDFARIVGHRTATRRPSPPCHATTARPSATRGSWPRSSATPARTNDPIAPRAANRQHPDSGPASPTSGPHTPDLEAWLSGGGCVCWPRGGGVEGWAGGRGGLTRCAVGLPWSGGRAHDRVWVGSGLLVERSGVARRLDRPGCSEWVAGCSWRWWVPPTGRLGCSVRPPGRPGSSTIRRACGRPRPR